MQLSRVVWFHSCLQTYQVYAIFKSEILLFSLVSSRNEASANTLHLRTYFLLFLQTVLNPIAQMYLIIIVSNRKTVISKHSALVRKPPLLREGLQWTCFSLWRGAFPCLWLLAWPCASMPPDLTWKPLLSNGFESPIVKEKIILRPTMGVFNCQFNFLEILINGSDEYWTIFCKRMQRIQAKQFRQGRK